MIPIDLPPSDGRWGFPVVRLLKWITNAFDCVLNDCGCDDL